MLTRIETISTQVLLEKVKPSLFWSLLFAYFVHSLKSFHENANLKKNDKIFDSLHVVKVQQQNLTKWKQNLLLLLDHVRGAQGLCIKIIIMYLLKLINIFHNWVN
jgi:hypothetical protein